MWIVVLFKDQKLCIEVTGEDTLQDIKNILTDVYGFSSILSFSYYNTPISDKLNMRPLNEIEVIQGKEVVELKVINQDKLYKDFKCVEPGLRQEICIQMGLSTDSQSANNESTPSSRRSNRSSSRRLNSQKQTRPTQNDQLKPAQNVQPQPAQNVQPKPAQNVQPKPAQNVQPKPAQKVQPKLSPQPPAQSTFKQTQNNQPSPAKNTAFRPAQQNTQTRPPPTQFTQPKQTFGQNTQPKQTFGQNTQAKPAQSSKPSQNAQQLMDMGFTQKQAEDALRSSNNDLNAAANLLLSNNTTTNAGSTSGTNNSNVQMLIDLGFTQKQAEDALRSHNNDPNAAANYLFGNM